MSGKKAATILIGIIAIVSILIVIAISLFFANYEPNSEESVHNKQSIQYDLKKEETRA